MKTDNQERDNLNRTVFWSLLSLAAAFVLALIVVPPFINMNRLAPRIESAILNQTGLHATIHGKVRLSLLGRAKISAHDITVQELAPGNRINYVRFTVPVSSIFNLGTAPIPNAITIGGADLIISQLSPPAFNNTLFIVDSTVQFMGKTYGNINGTLRRGMFSGTVRTNQHKYTFEIDGPRFVIRNPNVKLIIQGTLATDIVGRVSSTGTLAIATDKINDWFEFDIPQIRGHVATHMRYEWGGGGDFRFFDIKGTLNDAEFAGEVDLKDGHKSVQLTARNLNFDMSFLLSNPDYLRNSQFDLDLAGSLMINNEEINRLRLMATDTGRHIEIRQLEFSGPNLSGKISGAIDVDSAALSLDITKGDLSLRCDFSGTPEIWECASANIKTRRFMGTGAIRVTPDEYYLHIQSDDLSPELADLTDLREQFGTRAGNIVFDTPYIAGIVQTDDEKTEVRFAMADAALTALPATNEIIKVLPEMMRVTRGTVQSAEIRDGKLTAFEFQTSRWHMSVDKDGMFRFDGDLRDLLAAFAPDVDTRFLKAQLPIAISGYYKRPYITNLDIIIFDEDTARLSGKFDGQTFDLRADTLDLDVFINPHYLDAYESVKFVSAEPLVQPFLLNAQISLSAGTVKFGGAIYANFVYTLKPSAQKMSITDNARGDMLFYIDKSKTRYKLTFQTNNFALTGNILSHGAELNLADTTLTAQAELNTQGMTANDFWANMSGELDLAFTGGVVTGIGIDGFYANAMNITRTNLGNAVAIMLDGGTTQIKSLHIVGKYLNGEFETTRPFQFHARHSDAEGTLRTQGGTVTTAMAIILRGTSPFPEPVYLTINPGGVRNYSLFETTSKIDPEFMRTFIMTHDRF